MVKLSISLPGSIQIILESDEPDVIHQALAMLLNGPAQDVAQVGVPAAVAANAHVNAVEKGTGATPERPAAAAQSNGVLTAPLPSANESNEGLLLERQTSESRRDFAVFCQTMNPMGDMRRVVVAAEGASRFFKVDGVNAEELGELFDLIGWRRVKNFTQTLRNASRTKFGWLERIPSRAGCYAPTDLGRSVTLGVADA